MADRSDDDNTQTHIVLIKGTMIPHYRIIEKIGAGGMELMNLHGESNKRIACSKTES